MFPRSLYLFLLILSIGACSNTDANVQPNRIVYGLTLDPSSFDPHRNQSAEIGIVLRQVYDTLIYRHPETDEFVPGLATEWSISEDQTRYTFFLRDDVTFHDGTPFNAQAVAANLDRIINPNTASQKAIFMLGPYERYNIIDDTTIEIILAEPYSPLLDSLSQIYLGIASPTAFNEHSVQTYQFHQVGTGPFTFESFIPGDEIVLRRSANYTWGPDFYEIPATNAVDEVVFRFYTDPATRSLALESGDVQIMGELLPVDARSLIANANLQLVQAPIPGQPSQFLINTSRYPTDNLLVRQALITGANRSVILDSVFQGFSPIAWGPISASTLYYNRNLDGAYDHDIEVARDLLESAGFTDTDNDGFVNDEAGETLQVIVIVPPWGLTPEIAQLLQDQWRVIGIDAILQTEPSFPAVLEAVQLGEYHLVAFNTFGLDPSFLEQYFASDGDNNWANYSNPDLDQLLLEASQEADETRRTALYFQAQQLIMEDAVVLPIRDYVNLNAASATISGLQFDPYGWFPLLHNVAVMET